MGGLDVSAMLMLDGQISALSALALGHTRAVAVLFDRLLVSSASRLSTWCRCSGRAERKSPSMSSCRDFGTRASRDAVLVHIVCTKWPLCASVA